MSGWTARYDITEGLVVSTSIRGLHQSGAMPVITAVNTTTSNSGEGSLVGVAVGAGANQALRINGR